MLVLWLALFVAAPLGGRVGVGAVLLLWAAFVVVVAVAHRRRAAVDVALVVGVGAVGEASGGAAVATHRARAPPSGHVVRPEKATGPRR